MLLRDLLASFARARRWLLHGLLGLLATGALLAGANWLVTAAAKDAPLPTDGKDSAVRDQSSGTGTASDKQKEDAARQPADSRRQKIQPDDQSGQRAAPAQERRDSGEKSDRARTPDRLVPPPFADLDELLKEPPPGIDPQEWERLRQLLRRQQEELRQMLEQLHRGQLQEDRRRIFPPQLRPPFFGEPAQRHPRLGVIVEPLHPALRDQLSVAENEGVLVREVVPDSPAAKVGIKPHDILLEIGGKTVPADPEAFVRLIRELPAGKVGKVVVLRKGKKETLPELELPEVPPARPRRPDSRILPFPAEPLLPGGYFLQVERSSDGTFRVQYREPGQTIRIEGTQADGKTSVSKIEITEGRETKTYDSLEALPAGTREKVNKVLDSALKGRFFAPDQQPKRFD
jgi:hypothetical protein